MEYRYKHILVDTEEQIKFIREQLNNNVSFDDLRTRYSTDPNETENGEIGFGSLSPSIESHVVSLPVGGISEPFNHKHGWSIVFRVI